MNESLKFGIYQNPLEILILHYQKLAPSIQNFKTHIVVILDSCSSSFFGRYRRPASEVTTKAPAYNSNSQTLRELALMGKLPKSEDENLTNKNEKFDTTSDKMTTVDSTITIEEEQVEEATDSSLIDSSKVLTHDCNPDYDKYYCLHGKCLNYTIFITCECHDGFIGERCDSKHPESIVNRE